MTTLSIKCGYTVTVPVTVRVLLALAPQAFAVAVAVYVNIVFVVTLVLMFGYQSYVELAIVVPDPNHFVPHYHCLHSKFLSNFL